MLQALKPLGGPMKLTKLSVTFLIALSMLGTTNSFAKTPAKKARTVIKNLTNDKRDLSDPYYQVKLTSIRELTEAEAYMYETENLNYAVNKNLNLNLTTPKKNGGFKIPNGVPGVESGVVGGDSSTAANNDANTNSNDNSSDNSTNSNVAPTKPVNKGGSANGGLAVGTGAGGNTSGGGVMGTVTSVLDNVIMIAEKLVALGDKVMPTIEKGRPALTNKPMQPISVLPRIDAKDPVVHEMGNWSIPRTKHYKITYSNGFGSTAASFVYSITYQYGGTYGGKGKYLAGVRVAAQDIQVNWGFDLDATSQLVQISNVGTESDIIAGATIEITYTVKNVMRVLSTTESFFVAGDGRLYKLD